jgi:UDP-N-acetylglucosamine transferase subunit ALG13
LTTNTHTKPLVLVTVGTDHHPFDRIVRWTDSWLAGGGDARARCFIQTGTSIAPTRAEWAAYLDYGEMDAKVRDATVVVCHGAGATIMFVSSLGKKPIVVPRRNDLGEHVDPHQILLSARLAREGQIELAETEEEFGALLDRACAQGGFRGVPRDEDKLKETVARFAELVEPLFAHAEGRR